MQFPDEIKQYNNDMQLNGRPEVELVVDNHQSGGQTICFKTKLIKRCSQLPKFESASATLAKSNNKKLTRALRAFSGTNLDSTKSSLFDIFCIF